MEHGISWLNFLPGYQQLQLYLNEQPKGVLGGTPMAQHIVAALLVIIVLLLLSITARRQLAKADDNGLVPPPGISLRNILELVLEALYKQSRQIIGKDAARYFPVIGTLALFIFFSNVLGLIPGFNPPTNNWNTTMACGGFVFIYFNFHGLRTNGLSYIAHLANPVGTWWGWFLAPLLFPIEVVSTCARPFTLGIRLAANMVGDHAVLAAIIGLAPWFFPLPIMALGLIVCVVQTLVFVLLTMIYIGMATADAHGPDDEHHEVAEAAAH